jgi:hypothetical protein
MIRALFLVGIGAMLFLAGDRASAEEPAAAAKLPAPLWFSSPCPVYSLTEPPQVQGLLVSPASAVGSRSLPSPQMIGGASVGLYRIAGNDTPLPVNRMFGTVSGLSSSSVVPSLQAKLPSGSR